MLKALGIENWHEWALLAAIIALVAITPLGHEATHPVVFGCYRLLLVTITLASIAVVRKESTPHLCSVFLGLCGLALFLMLVSIRWNPGSQFDGLYRWYQQLLFGAAFLAMATLNRHRTMQWKQTVLWSVVIIDLLYLTIDLVGGRRPLMGPFVNPNYFASFLLVGFSVSAALAIFETRRIQRALATGCGLFLYYGMTQAWSRGATLAAVGVAVLGIARFSQGRGMGRKKVALFVALVLAAGAAASPVLVRKFLDRNQLDPYNYERPQIWLSTLRIIAAHPVLGVGLGQFYHVSKQYSPPVEGTVARYLKRPAIAHSEYLQYAAESGIPCAILLFGLAGYLLHLAIKRARTGGPEQRVLQEASILVAAGLGFHALVDNNWSVPIMAAGLVVVSLADLLPLRPWNFTIVWTPRVRAVLAVGLLLLVLDSTLLPGVALYFNENGRKAFDRGEIATAESLNRLAAAIAPDYDVFLDNTGSVYFDMYTRSGDTRWLNYAETLFREANRANPNSEEPGRHLETLLIRRLTGNVRIDQTIHQQIIAVDREILRVDPFNPFVRKNLAEALNNSGDRTDAELEMNRAIEIEPNYVPAYLRIADWDRESGNLSASDNYRDKAIAIETRYRNLKTDEPYEALLLGRPDPTKPVKQ